MDVFVARQPIFDRKRQVQAYELLFRSGSANFFAAEDPDRATLQVLDNAFFVVGLDSLTGGKRAFVNFTRETLLQRCAAALPPSSLVVEILESIVPDADVLERCRELKRLGYALALDDYVLRDESDPLAELADIVKIDFLASPPGMRQRIANAFAPRGTTLLAEKIETDREFVEADALGCTYFQGYFFSLPEIVSAKGIPGFKLNSLLLLNEINAPEADFDAIEQLVKREVSLAFKILRYVNSAAFARRRIASLREALLILGLNGLRRWASIAVLSDLGQSRPSELVASSVLRARFCETLAAEVSLRGRAHDLFLMGLFSLIDALLGRPLPELLGLIPLPDDCRDALLGQDNTVRAVLDAVIAYERGDWERMAERAGQLHLDEQKLPAFYLEALRWTNGLTKAAVA